MLYDKQRDYEERLAARQARRDIWDQKTEQTSTLLVLNTLMFGCVFAIIVEGMPPAGQLCAPALCPPMAVHWCAIPVVLSLLVPRPHFMCAKSQGRSPRAGKEIKKKSYHTAPLATTGGLDKATAGHRFGMPRRALMRRYKLRTPSGVLHGFRPGDQLWFERANSWHIQIPIRRKAGKLGVGCQ